MADVRVHGVVEDHSEIKLLFPFFVLIFVGGVDDVDHAHHHPLQPESLVLPRCITTFVPSSNSENEWLPFRILTKPVKLFISILFSLKNWLIFYLGCG